MAKWKEETKETIDLKLFVSLIPLEFSIFPYLILFAFIIIISESFLSFIALSFKSIFFDVQSFLIPIFSLILILNPYKHSNLFSHLLIIQTLNNKRYEYFDQVLDRELEKVVKWGMLERWLNLIEKITMTHLGAWHKYSYLR